MANPWFKHFLAEWSAERERARDAVCELPVNDVRQLMLLLQSRGEAVAFGNVILTAQTKYDELVAQAQENERTK